MSSQGQAGPRILISYVGPDLMWAEWISEQLGRAGCVTTTIEASGGPEDDQATVLRQAAPDHDHCLLLVSDRYLRTLFPSPTAAAEFGEWASARPGWAIPALVRRGELPAAFWRLEPVDLRGIRDQRTAARRLLSRVSGAAATSGQADAESMTRFPGYHPPVWSPDLPPRNPFFTGRDAMLSDLRHRITTDVAAIVPHSLQGLAGVGKTQLAVEYAYRFAPDYDVVWWVPAERPAVARKALADLAIRLDLGGPQAVISELVRAAKDALRTGEPYDRWLVIFDNAGSPGSLQALLPAGSGHVLVTSRDQTWDRSADALDVDVYSRQESREFLLRRVPSLTRSESDRLATELNDIPLALEHAAGWLASTGSGVDEYLNQLAKHTRDMLDTGRFSAYEVSVASTWTLSVQSLREANPLAAQLLEICAFIGPDPIPLDLFAAAPAGVVPPELAKAIANPGERATALQAIRSSSLAKIVRRSARNEPTLQQHRLVQNVVRTLVDEPQQAAYTQLAHKLLAAANPGDPLLPENWPAFDVLLPHVISSGAATDPDPEVRMLVVALARELNLRGEHESALQIAQTAADAWSAVLGETDLDQVLAQREIGNALRGLNRFADARRVSQASYEHALRELGEDHPTTLLTIGGLAADHRRLGNFPAARELDHQAMEVTARLRGPDDPEAIRHAHNLAVDLRLAGEFEAALEINQHAEDVLTDLLGPDAFATIYAVNDTARDLRELGRYYEALSMQEHTYVQYLENFGADSPDTLRAMKNLAVSRRKAGRYAEAADLARDVLERHRRKYGERHLETIAAMTNYANDLRCLGRYPEGRGYAESALAGFTNLIGLDHPYTGIAGANLAILIRLGGDPAAARVMNLQMLELLGTGFGREHRYTLSCAVNLASDLAAVGDARAAAELGESVLTGLRDVSGATHPYTLSCAVNLALDLRAIGDRGAFRALLEKTMEGYRTTLGESHPEAQAAAARERAVCDIEPPPV